MKHQAVAHFNLSRDLLPSGLKFSLPKRETSTTTLEHLICGLRTTMVSVDSEDNISHKLTIYDGAKIVFSTALVIPHGRRKEV